MYLAERLGGIVSSSARYVYAAFIKSTMCVQLIITNSDEIAALSCLIYDMVRLSF